MRYKLKKLAVALRSLGQEEEAEELEEIIQSYYGEWLKELPQLASDLYGLNKESAEEVVREKYKNFYWAGSGAFRFVIGIIGDDSFVVKVAIRSRGSMMNESEFNKQLEFAGLLPKVHHHGGRAEDPSNAIKSGDFDWIVMDKVYVIKSEKELEQFFPELFKEAKEQNVSFVSSVLGKLLAWEAYREVGDKEQDFTFVNSIRTYVPFSSKGAEDKMIYKLLVAAKKDPMFKRLAAISSKLGIDARDLTVGNLGENSQGELMVIDASLEKDFSTSPYKTY